MEIICRSVEETLALGKRVGELCPAGGCVTLSGPLGVGKTHFARGLAEGARVADIGLVSSPTYVLLNIYPASPTDATAKAVYHLDAYRLHGAEDFAAVDLEELLEARGILAVEWPERVWELLPGDRLEIVMDPVDETSRRLELKGTGPESEALVRRLGEEWDGNLRR